jgi:ATP-binding cassette subfamily C protein
MAILRAITAPVAMSLFDLPWSINFMLGIFIFDPLLGYLAIAGGSILITIALLNQITSKRPLEDANEATVRAERMGEHLRNGADIIQALGMRKSAFMRWLDLRNKSLRTGIKAGDIGGSFGSLSKTFRLFLQSAMLGLGAYLVLEGELTPGQMIADSILLGCALVPIEMMVGQWPVISRRRSAWANLARLLGALPVRQKRANCRRSGYCAAARRNQRQLAFAVV